MRILIHFHLLILFLSLTNKYQAQCKTDLDRENLKGSVKEVIETGIYAEKETKEINHIETTKYNKKHQALGYTFASKYNDLKPANILFEFDEKGNRVMEKRYNIKNELENKIAYFYDAVGNEIESRFYNGDVLDNFEYQKFDSICNKIEYKAFYSDSSLWLWYTFKYNNEWVEVFDHTDSSVSKSKKDMHGNNIEIIDYDKSGIQKKITRYAYTYDSKNNWIKQTTYINDKIYWIDERVIKYN
jgi:hypothetical protein